MHLPGRDPLLLLSGLLRIVYPPICEGCGARTSERELPLCRRCLRTLDGVTEEAITERLLRLDPEAPRLFDSVFSLWTFDTGSPLHRVQHRMKYGNRPGYAERLGVFAGGELTRAGHPALGSDMVVPVPLHRARFYERGYNQSAALARGFARTLSLPVREDLLIRHRATASQTHLGRADRWENVRDAFHVKDALPLAGRTVLLVDDLLTTGATVTASAGALRLAGVTALHLCTLAMVRE